MRPFAVVVLAAGASTRLGRPKQLVSYRGQTLVSRAVSAAIDSDAEEVIVVLGASAEAIEPHLAGFRAKVVLNEGWSEGMAGSIRRGLAAVDPDVESVVLSLVDQPHVPPEHLRSLGESSSPIAASLYEGILGAPCAFRRSEFPALRALKGDAGARALLRDAVEVEAIALPSAALDIDTEADVERLA